MRSRRNPQLPGGMEGVKKAPKRERAFLPAVVILEDRVLRIFTGELYQLLPKAITDICRFPWLGRRPSQGISEVPELCSGKA